MGVHANKRVCEDTLWDLSMYSRSCSNIEVTSASAANIRTSASKSRLPSNSSFGSSLSLYVRIGAEDIGVTCSKHDYVSALKQKIAEHIGEKDGRNIRLFFYGQEMTDGYHLIRCNG